MSFSNNKNNTDNRGMFTANPRTFSRACGSSTSPYSVPLAFSLLFSVSLFTHHLSPAASLIIPIFRPTIPFGYAIIIFLELMTALFTKWSLGPCYSLFNPGGIAALPDLEALRQINALVPRPKTKNLAPQEIDVNLQGEEDSPLLPLGMTINLSLSSPITTANSKTGTLFVYELKQIKSIPPYVVPIATLLLYLFLKGLFGNRIKE